MDKVQRETVIIEVVRDNSFNLMGFKWSAQNQEYSGTFPSLFEFRAMLSESFDEDSCSFRLKNQLVIHLHFDTSNAVIGRLDYMNRITDKVSIYDFRYIAGGGALLAEAITAKHVVGLDS